MKINIAVIGSSTILSTQYSGHVGSPLTSRIFQPQPMQSVQMRKNEIMRDHLKHIQAAGRREKQKFADFELVASLGDDFKVKGAARNRITIIATKPLFQNHSHTQTITALLHSALSGMGGPAKPRRAYSSPVYHTSKFDEKAFYIDDSKSLPLFIVKSSPFRAKSGHEQQRRNSQVPSRLLITFHSRQCTGT